MATLKLHDDVFKLNEQFDGIPLDALPTRSGWRDLHGYLADPAYHALDYERPRYPAVAVPSPSELRQGFDAIFQVDSRNLSRMAESALHIRSCRSKDAFVQIDAGMEHFVRQKTDRVGIVFTPDHNITWSYGQSGPTYAIDYRSDDYYKGRFETEGFVVEVGFRELVIRELGTSPVAELVWYLNIDLQLIETDESLDERTGDLLEVVVHDHYGNTGIEQLDRMGRYRRAQETQRYYRKVRFANGVVTVRGNLVLRQNGHSLHIDMETLGSDLRIWAQSDQSDTVNHFVDEIRLLDNLRVMLERVVQSDIRVSPTFSQLGRRPADLSVLGPFTASLIATEGNLENVPILSIAVHYPSLGGVHDLESVRPFVGVDGFNFAYCTSEVIVDAVVHSLWDHPSCPPKRIIARAPISIDHLNSDGDVVDTEQGQLDFESIIGLLGDCIASPPWYNLPSSITSSLETTTSAIAWWHENGQPILQRLPDDVVETLSWSAFMFNSYGDFNVATLSPGDRILYDLHKWVFDPVYRPHFTRQTRYTGEVFSSLATLITRSVI